MSGVQEGNSIKSGHTIGAQKHMANQVKAIVVIVGAIPALSCKVITSI